MGRAKIKMTIENSAEIKQMIKQYGVDATISHLLRETSTDRISISTKKSRGLFNLIQVVMEIDGSYTYSQFLDKAIKSYCKKVLETNIV